MIQTSLRVSAAAGYFLLMGFLASSFSVTAFGVSVVPTPALAAQP
jgi:hypothetical protein